MKKYDMRQLQIENNLELATADFSIQALRNNETEEEYLYNCQEIATLVNTPVATAEQTDYNVGNWTVKSASSPKTYYATAPGNFCINKYTEKVYLTPINALKIDRLNEVINFAINYLMLAYQYTDLKSKGSHIIKIDNQLHSIEDLLNNEGQIKSIILKYGFTIKDSQSIRRIVASAVKEWLLNYAMLYQDQHIDIALHYSATFKHHAWSKMHQALLDEEKIYRQISQKMLKNAIISKDIIVDLTCARDILETISTADAKTLLKNNEVKFISLEEFEEINTYMETLGLKTDYKKMKYLSEFIASTTSRKNTKKDNKLLNIMLKYCPEITYTDGLQQTISNNRHLVFCAYDKVYDISQLINE